MATRKPRKGERRQQPPELGFVRLGLPGPRGDVRGYTLGAETIIGTTTLATGTAFWAAHLEPGHMPFRCGTLGVNAADTSGIASGSMQIGLYLALAASLSRGRFQAGLIARCVGVVPITSSLRDYAIDLEREVTIDRRAGLYFIGLLCNHTVDVQSNAYPGLLPRGWRIASPGGVLPPTWGIGGDDPAASTSNVISAAAYSKTGRDILS